MTGDGKKRLEACWRYFNPPPRLANATFGDFMPRTTQQADALEKCQTYTADDIAQGRGLFLFGTYGTGKTHLAVATVRRLMEADPERFGVRLPETETRIYGVNHEDYKGLYCSFFSVVDLLDAMRPGSEVKQVHGDWLFYRARYDDLVVLDDIGAEKATDWVAERLYSIIDTRYRMERATIFTSNLSEKKMQDRLGGRIVSRIFEMTEQVPVIGPDYRRKMA